MGDCETGLSDVPSVTNVWQARPHPSFMHPRQALLADGSTFPLTPPIQPLNPSKHSALGIHCFVWSWDYW